MAGNIDWIVVTGNTNKKIGAVGFIGDQAAVIVSFYDYRDGNQDGKVSWGEAIGAKLSPFDLKKKPIAEVAMQARYDTDVMMRDPGFNQMAVNIFLNFASGLVADGVYAAYFSRAVGGLAGGVAGGVTSNVVKQFAIKKGMESAVKQAYQSATR